MLYTLTLIHWLVFCPHPQVQAPSLPIRGLHAIRKGLKRNDDHADEHGHDDGNGGGSVRKRIRVKSPAPSRGKGQDFGPMFSRVYDSNVSNDID